MKLLIDAMGAPAESGGMRAYTENLVWAWSEAFSEDELVVAGGGWIRDSFPDFSSPSLRVLPDTGLSRIRSQWIGIAHLARAERFDAVHSMSPVVTPFSGLPRSNTVHDWRHRLRPGEFSIAQRAYRRSWSWSTGKAGTSIQISDKTGTETMEFVVGAKVVVAPNGTDHARRWATAHLAATDEPGILTFGHHTNKRPHLVVEALSTVRDCVPDITLTVLGARGELAQDLRGLAKDGGVEQHLRLPGFVSDEEYRRLVQAASVVVLASTDEGFALPVAEAAWFGIPVVVTDDNGVAGLHDYEMEQVEPTPDGIAAGILRALRNSAPAPALTGQTWAETATQVRAAILAGLAGGRAV